MPLGDHLEELRKRIIRALIGLLPIVVVSMYFGREMMVFLFDPAIEAMTRRGLPADFQVVNPFEGFSAYLRLSLIMAVIVGGPWVLYQLWLFVAPGLYTHERRFAYFLAPLSVLLTAAGMLFLYFVMLPVILFFFAGWNSGFAMPTPPAVAVAPETVFPIVPVLRADPAGPEVGAVWFNTTLSQMRVCISSGEAGVVIKGIRATGQELITQQYRVGEYISLVFNLALAIAVGFQMPVVVLLLGWAGLVTPEFLGRYRKYAILGCAVIGAILTPADVVSMLVLAVPLYLLFEMGVLLLRAFPASRVAGPRIVPAGEPQDEPPDA